MTRTESDSEPGGTGTGAGGTGTFGAAPGHRAAGLGSPRRGGNLHGPPAASLSPSPTVRSFNLNLNSNVAVTQAAGQVQVPSLPSP